MKRTRHAAPVLQSPTPHPKFRVPGFVFRVVEFGRGIRAHSHCFAVMPFMLVYYFDKPLGPASIMFVRLVLAALQD